MYWRVKTVFCPIAHHQPTLFQILVCRWMWNSKKRRLVPFYFGLGYWELGAGGLLGLRPRINTWRPLLVIYPPAMNEDLWAVWPVTLRSLACLRCFDVFNFASSGDVEWASDNATMFYVVKDHLDRCEARVCVGWEGCVLSLLLQFVQCVTEGISIRNCVFSCSCA